MITPHTPKIPVTYIVKADGQLRRAAEMILHNA